MIEQRGEISTVVPMAIETIPETRTVEDRMTGEQVLLVEATRSLIDAVCAGHDAGMTAAQIAGWTICDTRFVTGIVDAYRPTNQ